MVISLHFHPSGVWISTVVKFDWEITVQHNPIKIIHKAIFLFCQKPKPIPASHNVFGTRAAAPLLRLDSESKKLIETVLLSSDTVKSREEWVTTLGCEMESLAVKTRSIFTSELMIRVF